MRIDAYNQIAQVYGVQKTMKTQKAQNVGGLRDQVSISQAGRDFQVAQNAVSEASDVREDKIARLKAQIKAGTYSVDPELFANKLLENYNVAF